MKFKQTLLSLGIVAAVLVSVMINNGSAFAATIHAKSYNETIAYMGRAIPVGKTLTITTHLNVNCSQKTTPQMLAVWKAHSLCGNGITAQAVMPNDTISGTCGDLTDQLTNIGGGNAKNRVTISLYWWTLGFTNAFYIGQWSNYGSGGIGLFNGTRSSGGDTFSWDSVKNYYTDVGTVNFTVGTATADSVDAGQCEGSGASDTRQITS